MSKGIVTSKPRATENRPGQLIITEIDQPEWVNKIVLGSPLNFSGILEMNKGDLVECNITSLFDADITKVIGPSTLAQGIVTATHIQGTNIGNLKVTRVCDPNPFNVRIDDKRSFGDPNSEWNKDDLLAIIPTQGGYCEIVEVLQPA